MTKDNSKFVWQSDDIQVLGPDGKPKPESTETSTPETNPDRSDRFSWKPGEVEILDSSGNPKKK